MKLLQKWAGIVGVIAIAAFITFFATPEVAAQSLQDGVNAAQGSGQPSTLFGGGSIVTTIINIMLFIVGALSVIMIIIGGLRYVLSGGNASNVTAAKNTILYALVGLIVAFVAFAAVNFILGVLSGNSVIDGFGGGGGGNGVPPTNV